MSVSVKVADAELSVLEGSVSTLKESLTYPNRLAKKLDADDHQKLKMTFKLQNSAGATVTAHQVFARLTNTVCCSFKRACGNNTLTYSFFIYYLFIYLHCFFIYLFIYSFIHLFIYSFSPHAQQTKQEVFFIADASSDKSYSFQVDLGSTATGVFGCVSGDYDLVSV